MNTNDKPTSAAADRKFETLVNSILSGLREQDLSITLSENRPVEVGTLQGHTVCFRIEGLAQNDSGGSGFVDDERPTQHGAVFLTFSYLRQNDLQAALQPDLSIGNRYHPAGLAKRTGAPVPATFDTVAASLQRNYFRVVTDEDRLPAEVTDCRLLFARGNWHPQVDNLTQAVVADLKWVPAN